MRSLGIVIGSIAVAALTSVPVQFVHAEGAKSASLIPAAKSSLTSRDKAVFDCVLRDLATFSGTNSPCVELFRNRKTVAILDISTPVRDIDSIDLGSANEHLKRSAVDEIVSDVTRRNAKPSSLRTYKLDASRYSFETQAQLDAATITFDRPIFVELPGYSSDGRYAVIQIVFPWGIHSGTATYILSRTSGGWSITARDFVYNL